MNWNLLIYIVCITFILTMITLFITAIVSKHNQHKYYLSLKEKNEKRRFELLDVFILYDGHYIILFIIKDINTSELFGFFTRNSLGFKDSLVNCFIDCKNRFKMTKTDNNISIQTIDYSNSKYSVNFYDKGYFWMNDKKNNNCIKKKNKYYFKELCSIGYKVGYKYIGTRSNKYSKGDMFNLNSNYDIKLLDNVTLTNGVVEFDM